MAIRPAISVVRDAPKLGRKERKPKHHFNVTAKPWQIQPFMIAPVLPGETMSSLLVQGICRSAPLKSDQLGWWFENFYFYVKHRDLMVRDQVTLMHMDPSTDLAPLRGPANANFYEWDGAVDWVGHCMAVITQEYFRDESEPIMAASIDGLPLASLNVDNFLDSAILESAAPAHDDELPGESTDMPDQGIPAGFEAAYAHWEHMRALQLFDATFEDYLKSFGVKPAKELQVNEIHRPELIRYVREWAYPQVKYDAESGSAAPQMIWNISERADKDRFFQEPGFIVGVCVMRPKVYLGHLTGAAVGMLDNAYSWLPAVLDDAPFTSLRQFQPGAAGPLRPGSTDEAYWIDVKDLFMHGDQFFKDPRFTSGGPPPSGGGGGGGVILPPIGTGGDDDPDGPPTGDTPFLMAAAAVEEAPYIPGNLVFPSNVADASGRIRARFGSEQDFYTLFADHTKPWYQFEGVVSLAIKSRLRDTSL